jgi:hypothetical protein
MSKIGEVREVIDGRHVMGTTDGLRDYHAAREAVMSSCRKKDPYAKLAAVKTALKNYNVRVTLGPVMDVMITSGLDGSGQYTVI